MQGGAMKVFFSYARADAQFALRLAEDMRGAGVDLWIDQLDIPVGAQWDRAVEDALKSCPRLLIILSPTSTASQNVMDEASFAIEQNKQILPVLFQHCDIPFRLKRLQYLDFTSDYDQAFTKLLMALSTYPPGNGIKTPSAKPSPPQRISKALSRRLTYGALITMLLVVIAAGSYWMNQTTTPDISGTMNQTTTPDISGTWSNQVGVVLRITQQGKQFSYEVDPRLYKEKATGRIDGLNVYGKWEGDKGTGEITGKILLGEGNRAEQIQWLNGAVFKKRQSE
jgi:hypothetical protein